MLSYKPSPTLSSGYLLSPTVRKGTFPENVFLKDFIALCRAAGFEVKIEWSSLILDISFLWLFLLILNLYVLFARESAVFVLARFLFIFRAFLWSLCANFRFRCTSFISGGTLGSFSLWTVLSEIDLLVVDAAWLRMSLVTFKSIDTEAVEFGRNQSDRSLISRGETKAWYSGILSTDQAIFSRLLATLGAETKTSCDEGTGFTGIETLETIASWWESTSGYLFRQRISSIFSVFGATLDWIITSISESKRPSPMKWW